MEWLPVILILLVVVFINSAIIGLLVSKFPTPVASPVVKEPVQKVLTETKTAKVEAKQSVVSCLLPERVPVAASVASKPVPKTPSIVISRQPTKPVVVSPVPPVPETVIVTELKPIKTQRFWYYIKGQSAPYRTLVEAIKQFPDETAKHGEDFYYEWGKLPKEIKDQINRVAV